MLELRNISFSYENKQIFRDFSMEMQDGELLALMGASGCGKTTLLAIAGGILRPQSGFVISNAQQIAHVFQEPRLLPWCTVKENLFAVLKTRPENDSEIDKLLDTVGLSGCKNLYPGELSGGMKSRVSLARAMLYGGDLFLLDEPFAALDENLRKELSLRLRNDLKKRGASAILVTHHPSDAELFADRILKLE